MADERDRLGVRLRLPAGRDGTKKLTKKYGDRLICVRYRYDEQNGKRYKTVELIEEEMAWQPPRLDGTKVSSKLRSSDRCGVRIGYGETELREQAKACGAIWRPKQKLWEMSFAQVLALGLEDRMVGSNQELYTCI